VASIGPLGPERHRPQGDHQRLSFAGSGFQRATTAAQRLRSIAQDRSNSCTSFHDRWLDSSRTMANLRRR